MENMICPKCGKFQPKAENCEACGVIVAKLRKEATPTQTKDEPADVNPSAAVSPDGVDQTVPELPKVAKIAIVSILIAVGVGVLVVITPKEMRIDEFVEAKKSSFHLRGFRIEGTVEPHRSIIQTQSSDGTVLSSLKITGNDTTGYVTYDPSEITEKPKKGDYVTISGSFQSVPYFDGSQKHKKITMALATSIKLIRAAPPGENQ